MKNLEDLLQYSLVILEQCSQKLLEEKIGVLRFVPRKLEIAFRLLHLKCKQFPCETCLPPQHRKCTLLLEDRLTHRYNVLLSRKDQPNQRKSRLYFSHSKKLFIQCYQALSGGYGRYKRL